MPDFREKLTKITPYILLGLIALVLTGVIDRYTQHRKVFSEVEKLEAEVSDTEEENQELEKNLEDIRKGENIDIEARKRLNLKKEGERVVIILPPDKNTTTTGEKNSEDENGRESLWKKIKSWFQ